jgi:DNA polymerase-3 subunit gamma/tau
MAEGVVEHVRHILILKVDPDGADLVAASGEDLKRLRAQGEGWTENDLLRLLRIVSEVSTPMRDSPQPLVHLEAAILQMSTLEPGETLAQLLQRLEALERRLGGSSGEGSSGGGARSASAAAPKPAATSPAPMPATRTSPPARPDGGRSLLSGLPRSNPAEPRALASAPAPAAPAPRAATGVGLEDAPLVHDAEAERAWTEVLARINQRKRLLGAFLEESVFLGRAGGSLVIAMDDLHRAVIDEKENRLLLGEEVRRVFGVPLVLQSAPLEAARDAGRMPSAEETRAMVEKALDWFGGEAVTTPQRSDERTIR